jgi:glycosyltransferase involved in cell wall biosynthesis
MYNVACVIKAFSLIQKRYENASLMIAGDGAEKERLCRLARDLDLKNVEFVGPVPQDAMPALYAKADIYLNASNIDNMPNSIIEAFAAGTLVISTNAGGIPYVVTDGENGYLVERDDHRAMAEKAINALENHDPAQRIIANAFTESAKYTWENVRGKWIDLYGELANQK